MSLSWSRDSEGIDLAAFEQAENLVISLIARDRRILQMRDRAAHGGRVIHGRYLDTGLIERLKIRGRRTRFHDVGRIGHLIDRPE
jgi:hypothetical protein